MTRIIRTTTRILATAGLTAGVLTTGMGAAAAADHNPSALQFTTANGEIRCEVLEGQDGQHIQCVSDAPQARAAHAECNPPQALIPAVQLAPDNSTSTGCYNQGLNGQPEPLGPGEVRVVGDTAIVATHTDALQVWREGEDTALVYAGPNYVYGLNG